MTTPASTCIGPSRRSPLLWLALPLVGLVGPLAALLLLGVIPWPFGTVNAAPSNSPLPQEGMVAVPVAARAIPIYSTVTRDDLLDPETAQVKVIYLPAEAAQPNFLTDPGKVVGRVTSREQPKGHIFTEEDFLPEKTSPGVVAGVPPGKRAIALDADKIRGVVHVLKAGDHLDLLASIPVDTRGSIGGKGGYPGLKPAAGPEHPDKQALVKVLVHNGVVITPVPARGDTTGAVASRSDHEIVIAVEPAEVAPLSEAMTTKVDIVCVARSGQPAGQGEESVTPGQTPEVRKPIVIEVFKSGRRSLVIFDGEPRPGDQAATPPATKGSAAGK